MIGVYVMRQAFKPTGGALIDDQAEGGEQVRTASNLIGRTFEATNVSIAKLVAGRSQNRLFACYQAALAITK